MKCFLVHGFNVKDDGDGSMGKLLPLIRARNIQAVQWKYGWQGLLGVRLASRSLSKALASNVEDGDIGIGHSNGCHLLYRAKEFGANFKFLIFIAPALDSFTPEGRKGGNIYVLHSRHDFATKAARFLLFHRWGDMGTVGSTFGGSFKNIDCSGWAKGHCDYFSEANEDNLHVTITRLFNAELTPDWLRESIRERSLQIPKGDGWVG